MTIMESLSFTYNNESSDYHGLLNVNLEDGMLEDPFLPNKSLLEEKIRGRDTAYYMGAEYEPLEFALQFAFRETFDLEKIRRVARWLTPGYYASLIFESKPSHLYYCQPVGDAKLVHNGLRQGYLTVTFRCNAPWAYTPVYATTWYDYSANTPEGTLLAIENIGDLAASPMIEIELVNGSSFSILNTSDSGRAMSFTGLQAGEKLTIDTERRDIGTSAALVYRYGNMTTNSEWLRLVPGFNYLNVKGNVKVRISYQAPLYG